MKHFVRNNTLTTRQRRYYLFKFLRLFNLVHLQANKFIEYRWIKWKNKWNIFFKLQRPHREDIVHLSEKKIYCTSCIDFCNHLGYILWLQPWRRGDYRQKFGTYLKSSRRVSNFEITRNHSRSSRLFLKLREYCEIWDDKLEICCYDYTNTIISKLLFPISLSITKNLDVGSLDVISW